jgi:hypothetical protein
MARKTVYLVVSEDGDGSQVESTAPEAAVEKYVNDYAVEADPGYKFHVFNAEDPKEVQTFEFALRVVPSRGT